MRILLVDDDATLGAMMPVLLRDSRYGSFTVETVQRIAAALGILERNGIDLVILDLGLPDSAGFEGLIELLRSHPAIPVVVLTGGWDFPNALRALALGAQEFIAKPITDTDGFALTLHFAAARQKRTLSAIREAEAKRVLEAKPGPVRVEVQVPQQPAKRKSKWIRWIGIIAALIAAIAALLKELI